MHPKTMNTKARTKSKLPVVEVDPDDGATLIPLGIIELDGGAEPVHLSAVQLDPLRRPMTLRCHACNSALERATATRRDAPGWHTSTHSVRRGRVAPGVRTALTVTRGACPECHAPLAAISATFSTRGAADHVQALSIYRATHRAQLRVGEWLVIGEGNECTHYFGPIEASRLPEAWALLDDMLPWLPHQVPRPEAA